MVSELPWDPKRGTLKRELAEGMMNPACKHALEAALVLKNRFGAHITAITMGPPMAEEVLREALAMGADRGILLSDPKMAGADTLATSYTLGKVISNECRGFDLILCGCNTTDSETAQVGPQLIEELDIPGVTFVDEFEINANVAQMKRSVDGFIETLEMDLPGLITLSTNQNKPRYSTMLGVEEAFANQEILNLTCEDLNINPQKTGIEGSPTKILDVYSPTTEKNNIVLSGSAKSIVDQLLDKFDDKIGGAIGRDLKKP